MSNEDFQPCSAGDTECLCSGCSRCAFPMKARASRVRSHAELRTRVIENLLQRENLS